MDWSLVWTLACENAARHPVTGLYTLHGVFDAFLAGRFPVYRQVEFVSHWQGPAKTTAEIVGRLVRMSDDPYEDENIIEPTSVKVLELDESGRVTYSVIWNGGFPTEGEYRWEWSADAHPVRPHILLEARPF